MPKPNKQVVITEIQKQIAIGKSRGNVLAFNGKKWQLSKRTFDRYWKVANEQHRIERKRLNHIIETNTTIKELEAVKLNIMTANNRKVYLTKILNGELKIKKPFVIKGKIMEYPAEPDHADRLKALAELNKMEGEYAPTKIDTNISTIKIIRE